MSVVVLTSHQQLLIESTRIVSLRRCRNRLNYPWINPEWKPCARFPNEALASSPARIAMAIGFVQKPVISTDSSGPVLALRESLSVRAA